MPTIEPPICQTPGSNSLSLQRNVQKKMEELSRRLPAGIDYAMHYDTTRFVAAAMHDVLLTLAAALMLVVLVVFVFLQSLRTTLIPVIAIPVSLIATLVIMEVLRFSSIIFSLFAMVLAHG